MPEDGDQPAKPPRTWRPMVGWTLGILAVLGLAWFVGAVAVPVWQVRRVIREPSTVGLEEDIQRLGGPDRAAPKLGRYLGMPDPLAERKPRAASLLGFCGRQAVPILVRATSRADREVRLKAFESLGKVAGSGLE